MKTGIITLLGNNYGNRLQNYAVQEILKEYGEVYTVRYEKRVSSGQHVSGAAKWNPAHIKAAIDSRCLNLYFIRNDQWGTLQKAWYFLKNRNRLKDALAERDRACAAFDHRYIQYQEDVKLHLDGDEEENWISSYDAWVCGSDQIWNPNYPTATSNAFLQFAQQERRIAFSASFGISDVHDLPKDYDRWIREIPYLSVREESAAQMIRQLNGRQAEVFLDPTMLLPQEKWEEMARSSGSDFPESFALVYFLGKKTKEYIRYIESEVSASGLKIVSLLDGEHPEYLKVSPDQFVDAFRKASFIYTDSFHGTVFSILFHRQFTVFDRIEDGKSMNSRLNTLLKTFHLESRMFHAEDTKPLDHIIDFALADQILFDQRNRTAAFLNHAMGEIQELEKCQPVTKVFHISPARKEYCFGCSACSQICPKHCIDMKADIEGFLYPAVDTSLCISCGRCIRVCPYHHREENPIRQVYAAMNQDMRIRKASSSGGTFDLICREVIADGGVVYGCVWNEDMEAVHQKAETMEQAGRFHGSKYVQSRLDHTFTEARTDLESGKFVIFSGTPCQVAGFKNFLGKNYDNLLLVDVLCHGTPSPLLLAEYIRGMEQKHHDTITDMDLRDKAKSWHRLHTRIQFRSGKTYDVFCGYDTYMSMFLTNMSQRPSCYECKFTTAGRQGDITLGDFWGIGKHVYEMDDDKGTSMVAVNTLQGQKMWERIRGSLTYVESDYMTAESGNKVLSCPPPKNPNRDAFYQTFAAEGYEAAAAKYISIPGKPKQIFYDIMRKVLDLYRFIFHIKY